MSTAITTIENQLTAYSPQFMQVLPENMPPERIIRTVLIACEQNPKLMQANRETILRSAMSAAVLGLEVDGVTGQGYLMPFKGQCQFVPGYKGYVTLAHRSHRTLEGFIVYEGDSFECDEANGIVNHTRKFGDENKRDIVAAYATSRSVTEPTIVRAMSIDQLLEVRNGSAGYKAMGQRSTWNTNFAAMCRKTPMRRLANDLPVLAMQVANAMETQQELGRAAYVNQDMTVSIEKPKDDQSNLNPLTDTEDLSIVFPNETRVAPDINRWLSLVGRVLSEKSGEPLQQFAKDNLPIAKKLADKYPDKLLDIVTALEDEIPPD